MPDLLPLAWTVMQVIGGFVLAYWIFVWCVEALIWLLERWGEKK